MRSFKLNDVLVLPIEFTVITSEGRSRIPHRAMDILVFLADNQQRIVSRKELHDMVWNGIGSADELVSRAVADLRKSLQDSAKNPVYIQTITGKGIRLMVKPNFLSETAGVKHPLVKQRQTLRRRWLVAIATIFTLIVLSSYLYRVQDPTSGITTSPPFIEKKPVFSTQHDERFPRFSTSGRYILSTVIQKSGLHAVVLFDIDTQAERVLLQDDNASLVNGGFTEKDETFFYKKYANDRCALYLFNLITETSRPLGTCQPISTSAAGDISMANDSVISYTATRESLKGFDFRRISDGSVLFEHFPAKDSGAYFFPRYSADKQRVAYVNRDYERREDRIEILDVATRNIIYSQLIPGAWLTQVIWADDNTLLFSETRTAKSGIYTLSLADASTSLIMDGKYSDFDYNRRHKRIVLSQDNNKRAIKSIDLSRAAPSESNEHLAYSPTLDLISKVEHNNRLIYTKTQLDKHLLIMSDAEGHEIPLFTTTLQILRLKTTIHGDHVGIVVFDGQKRMMHLIDAVGHVLHSQDHVQDFTWLSSTEMLYIDTQDKRLWRLDIVSGLSTPTGWEPPSSAKTIALVNRNLYFQSVWGGTVQVYDLDSNASKVVVEAGVTNWQVNDDYIVYTLNKEYQNQALIMLKNLTEGTTLEVDSINYSGEWYLEMALTQQQLTYAFPSISTHNEIYLTNPIY